MNCTYCGSSNHKFEYCLQTGLGQTNRKLLVCITCGSKSHNDAYHANFNAKDAVIIWDSVKSPKSRERLA